MHTMVATWAIFTVVLLIAEPLYLHRWFHVRAESDPEGSFLLVARLHIALLTLSLVTVAAAVLGAHGRFSEVMANDAESDPNAGGVPYFLLHEATQLQLVII